MRYRVAIIRKSGKVEGENFNSLEECYKFILKEDYKKYRILDKKLNKVVEKG